MAHKSDADVDSLPTTYLAPDAPTVKSVVEDAVDGMTVTVQRNARGSGRVAVFSPEDARKVGPEGEGDYLITEDVEDAVDAIEQAIEDAGLSAPHNSTGYLHRENGVYFGFMDHIQLKEGSRHGWI